MMGISYQKKRQTPKRKAVGSNPAKDTRLNAENLSSIRGFRYFLLLFFSFPSSKQKEKAALLAKQYQESGLFCISA